MLERIIYTPFYSFFKYVQIKCGKKLKHENNHIGEQVEVKNSTEYTIFKEICLLTQSNKRKNGVAIFQVVFHTPGMKIDTAIRRTKYTIPFFLGLPGFCNKQFMVHKESNTFSGRYEWETVNMAKKYAESFAVKLMARCSKPFPFYYRIIDKNSGKIVEENEIK